MSDTTPTATGWDPSVMTLGVAPGASIATSLSNRAAATTRRRTPESAPGVDGGVHVPTTNSRVRRAFEENRIIRRVTSDPAESDLEGGEIWFRSDNNEWRGYDGENYVTLDVTVDGA